VRLDCKDRPARKACVERSARLDNLECPAHLECPAPRVSAARWECRALRVSAENRACPDPQDPKVRLDCKDRPARKACVERSARLDNLECPAHLECPAPRASAAR
jgi:hypothetical protein